MRFSAGPKYIKMFTIHMLIFSIVFSILVAFYYIGFQSIIGNPMLILVATEQTPLIESIKGLF